MNNDVTLVINGNEYGGWKDVSISAGIERAARDFKVSITRSWPNAPQFQRLVQPFDGVQVYIGSDLVLTGDIDATPINYDEKEVRVAISGRSKTARLVDCSAVNSPGQWSGVSVERIAQDLAKPYGVTVRALVDTGGPVADHQIQQGESAFESLDRLLALRQLMATDDASGDLLLIEAGTERSSGALVLGENVLRADAGLDFKEVYSHYTVKGQRASSELDDEDDPLLIDSLRAVSSSTTDSLVPYRRELLIKQCGQTDDRQAADQARYERDYRRAKALLTRYTVQGWRTSAGGLWLPNTMVPIKDGLIGIDTEWLIAEVEYSLSSAGSLCSMQVAPRAGFIRPLESANSNKKGKGRKGRKKKGSEWGHLALQDDANFTFQAFEVK